RPAENTCHSSSGPVTLGSRTCRKPHARRDCRTFFFRAGAHARHGETHEMSQITLANSHGYGLCIDRNPATQPGPSLAALAIDRGRPSELWSWRPGYDYPQSFDRGGVIAMRCFRTMAGDRVFLPDWGDDWEGFVRAAARYG